MDGLYPPLKNTQVILHTNAQRICFYKCCGLRYEPDVSLLLLFKRWDHFTPIAYTVGLKTTTNQNMLIGSCNLLTMYECPRLHSKKIFFRFLLCLYKDVMLSKCTARKTLLWQII